MAKLKPVPVQLTLFDTCLYERSPPIDDRRSLPDNSLTEPQTLTKSVSELFSSLGDSGAINSLTEPQTLTEPVIELFTPASGLSTDAVNLYSPGNTKGRYQYFRFSWRSSSGVNHRHIPGGNSTSTIASSRAAQVREAIASGSSAAAVLELIRSWTRKK